MQFMHEILQLPSNIELLAYLENYDLKKFQLWIFPYAGSKEQD